MRRRVLWATVLLIGVLLALGAAGPQVESDSTPADRVTLTVFDGEIAVGQVQARVADGPIERYRGLSGVETLGPNEGMVFVYPAAGERSFVMRDMAVPLDIIFVGADRRVSAISHAAADDQRQFVGQARWVIEVKRGYAAAHGIQAGDRVAGLPD